MDIILSAVLSSQHCFAVELKACWDNLSDSATCIIKLVEMSTESDLAQGCGSLEVQGPVHPLPMSCGSP